MLRQLRVKANFFRQINLILSVQSPSQKFSTFSFTQISNTSLIVPPPLEGRFAIVTDVGGGMRWTLWRGKTNARRRTVKSCGPDASTPASSSWEASFLGVTVTRKPDHRGDHEVSRKTIARGMPGVFRCDRGD
jgi:hypothetical protein